jgi:hypothetical protein
VGEQVSERPEIDLGGTVMDFLVTMSEGNPGAITVLSQVLKSDEDLGFLLVLQLDDMNIRGTQVWIGYKDYCGQDIDKFIDCVKNRDPEMIRAINEEGVKGNHKDKAVHSGASFPGGRFLLGQNSTPWTKDALELIQNSPQ